ncbi:LOW QUALITY PROTEIN: reverse transcriptase [Phytophthora megakarya]|uniref:Reverse transcriptase n=1 Tax=Phytophthora megakarya TaxID=4795 RepID=A0A225WAQ4_9STRA|nr:LOW QUALITY PROTEIN: reverse transcriptase [Phytophthora megakarya]
MDDASGLSDTPVQRLEREYERVMRVTVEELNLEPAVYLREGTELLDQLSDHLNMFPELEELIPECDIDKADVGVPGVATPEMEDKMRKILNYHRRIFLGDGNAAPAPARGVVCDLDVGDAMPIALRARQTASRFLVKVYEQLKKLLETGLIEHSESEWSSPIVIVLKNNGEDIRMLINQLIKLPLIDDLLTDFNAAAWFMSLDMVSGFWSIQMTEWVKLISACVCLFGHFQWIRMPFGVKNAPVSECDQQLSRGFVPLPPEEEATVDRDVLEFLKLTVPDTGPTIENPQDEGGFRLPELIKLVTAFRRNIPIPTQIGPVLGRSSYIDVIAHGAPTWDKLCEDLNARLFRLRYWHISVSLPKSEFGKQVIPYLRPEVCVEGIRATPKIAKSVQDLPFPSILKGVQSFLGSLNYYNKFIEDLPVVAALRHPDCTKPFVIIPHANPWAACAVLGQEHEGIIQPVRFTGRVLNESELRYHIAEKEV